MIKDKIVPVDELEPIYLDRGIYFGDGVYEVVRSYEGRIFALEEHLQRFANSMAAIDIAGVDIDQIRTRILKAFEAADIPDAKIYFHITRGSAIREHDWDVNAEPNFFLTVTEAPDDKEEKSKGIAVSTHPDWRWKRCYIKSLNLLPNVLARHDAAQKGCIEAIFVDDSGFITEGSHSAFFAINEQTLQTAPLTVNILPSITRIFAIKAGKNIGLKIIEKSLTPQQACDSDELFIAVTTKDIVPVIRFDGKTIGDGKPGKYTKLLIEEFRSFTV
ncbi:MAG: amino acid aminotransferase [candidate division Zixibacteria bacterium]|nr:amino acid aminotransferase [candidate division Zixibacteria bacterium]NIS50285.1 amino acid aminotransferase [Phycisphaerae bacterium]NIU08030.1 amino acid aminotransferase [Phycisphaerae bacterium]NIW92045.1 amino acid aminotransferase [Phycisphaerae bacterium]